MFATQETKRNIVIFVGSVLIFLGLNAYLKTTIETYPWASIAIGLILFIFARKIV